MPTPLEAGIDAFGESIADSATGARRAITNVLPGGILSTVGGAVSMLPDYLQRPALEIMGFDGVVPLYDGEGTIGEFLLDEGGKLQSGLITYDGERGFRNLQGQEVDDMFYDPQGTAREAGEVAGQVLATVAGAALGGPAGMVAMGAMVTSAAGNSIDGYYQYTKEKGLDYDPKVGASLGIVAGGAEFVFNKIPGVVRKRFRFVIPKGLKIGFEGVEASLRKTTQKAFVEALKTGNASAGVAALKGAGLIGMSEASEEALTEAFQQAITASYRGIGGIEGVTLEEVLEAAKKGAIYGGLAGGGIGSVGSGLKARAAGRAGTDLRADIQAGVATPQDLSGVQATLEQLGVSESDAKSLLKGIERLREDRPRGAQEAPEAAAEAEAAPDAAAAQEDAAGVLRAALGDTRDTEMSEEQAVAAASEANLLPSEPDKEYVLSGERDVDPEIGGSRPGLRLMKRSQMHAMAKRLYEVAPQLARAIRDKGSMTIRDLALFLPGDEKYLDGIVRKDLSQRIGAVVDKAAAASQQEAESADRKSELEAMLERSIDSEGRPLNEDAKANIRKMIEEIDTAAEPVTDQDVAVAESVANSTVSALGPIPLSSLKKTKLMQMAAELGIPGRSRMTKADLVTAIENQMGEGTGVETPAESVVSEAVAEEISAEITALQMRYEIALEQDPGSPEVVELEQQIEQLEDALDEVDPDERFEAQTREAEVEEGDVPIEEEVVETDVSEEQSFLDSVNETNETDFVHVPEEKLGAVARKALAFAKKLNPDTRVITYTSEQGRQGFLSQGVIGIRVSSDEQAGVERSVKDIKSKKGKDRYRKQLEKALLDSYVQTLMHENVHARDLPGGKDSAIAAVDTFLDGMGDTAEIQNLAMVQGLAAVEGMTPEQMRREGRAEALTDIRAIRASGMRSLYDEDATILERGFDRLRRLVSRKRGGKLESLVLQNYQAQMNALTSGRSQRLLSRSAQDTGDLQSQMRGRHEPNKELRDAASSYIESQGIDPGLDPGSSVEGVVSVDVARSKAIADLFDSLPSAINDASVLSSYAKFSEETVVQYEYLKGLGYQIIPWGSKGQPYANSREMVDDVRENRRIYYFKSINDQESSFGSDPEMMREMIRTNPLLRPAGGTVLDSEGNPHKQTVNDLFRAVHDIFGHAKEGHQFGPRGEENAWRQHVRMYSPEARAAMTTETRAQNSWVNYGSHLRREDGTLPSPGDEDFIHPSDRPYTDQKIVKFPSWVTAERGLDVEDWPDRPDEFQRRAQHVGGHSAKTAIMTEDLRDAISPELRAGGFELPYVPGQTPVLALGRDAHDRALRAVRVEYPVGTFTLEDMDSIKAQAIKDLKAMSPEAVPGAAADFTNANFTGVPKNYVRPLTKKTIKGSFPVMDPELLNDTFADESLREDKRFWYEASGDGIRSRTIFSPTNDIRRISNLLSATSPLTPVDDNFLRAYSIAHDHEHYGMSRVGTATASLVKREMRGEYPQSPSFKANSFGDTMAFLAGEDFDLPMSTNDIWVAYMYGFRTRSGGKVTGKNEVFSSPYAYAYTAIFNARLAEEINKRIRSSPEYAASLDRANRGEATIEDEVLLTPWTPWQLQAFPWSHLSDSGTFDESFDKAVRMLERAEHPSVVEISEDLKGIDLNEAGEDGGISRILQPSVLAREVLMTNLEVGGSGAEMGSERAARRIITNALKDPDLTKKQREQLLTARMMITRPINKMLGYLAGSGGGEFPFFSASSAAQYYAGVESSMKVGKVNSVVHQLYASLMMRPEIGYYPVTAAGAKMAGPDPDMIGPFEHFGIGKIGDIEGSTTGVPTEATAGFEQVRRRPDKGVKTFNMGWGMSRDGSGNAGYYDGVVSPNLNLSLFGLTRESQTNMLRLLGHALGQESVSATNWYHTLDPDSGVGEVVIFSRTGRPISADDTQMIQEFVDSREGAFFNMVEDTAGSHLVVYNTELRPNMPETEALAASIGADAVTVGKYDGIYVERKDYGAEQLLEEFVATDLAEGSEWRQSLSRSEERAVAEAGGNIGGAIRASSTIEFEAGDGSQQVRRALASSLRKSRAFRVHHAIRQIESRRRAFEEEVETALDQARAKVDAVDIEFQTRMQDPESPQFLRWFGSSKVVNDTGKPLTVYHGTQSDFDRFRTTISRQLGVGAYFTASPLVAEDYAVAQQETPDGGSIMPVYLKIENPFIVDRNMSRSSVARELGERHLEIQEELFESEADRSVDVQERAEFMNDTMRRLGYDGIIVREVGKPDTFIAFDPNQIKSAITTSEAGPTDSPRIDMQARQTSFDMDADLNSRADAFKRSAVAYGIPSNAVEVERDDRDVASAVAVYDRVGEDRRLIARYPTDFRSPLEWAEDLRDIVMSEPTGLGGWTTATNMDFEDPVIQDEAGDLALTDFMTRSTKDIESVMKTFGQELEAQREAGMKLSAAPKAFARWFRNKAGIMFHDEWLILQSMKDDIESATERKLPAKLDPMNLIRLAPGQIAETGRLFRTRTVNRVQQRMKEYGISNEQLGRFFAAKHALERNARIREINSLREDIKAEDRDKLNCGISDATANRLLEEHAADPKAAAIEEIAESMQEISYETAQIARYSGLISDEDFNRITGRYKWYVPMNVTGGASEIDGREFITDPVDDVIDRLRRGSPSGVQRDVDVATGRRAKLKFTLGRKESEQTVNAIVRGAVPALFVDRIVTEGEAIKSRIANRMLRLAQRYPNKILRVVTKKDLEKRRINEEGDQVVVTTVDPASDPSLLPIRLEETREIDGQTYVRGDIVYLKVEDEELVKRLGGGVETLSRGQAALNLVLSPLRTMTNLIRFTSTQWFTIEFTFTQPLLDGQTAILGAFEQGAMSPKDMVRQMAKRMPSVLKTIARSEWRAKVRTKAETELSETLPAEGPLAEYWDEFRRIGGKQAWFDIQTVDGMIADMNAITSNDPSAKLRRSKEAFKKYFVDTYSVLNDLGDNMWRFSFYVTLRENGVSAEEAGVLARNLTVDFSKKGELGGSMSQVYAFFNAAVGGNVRSYQQLFKGLKSGTGPARKAFTFLSSLGMLSQLALEAIGGGDEDDNGVPDYLEQIPEFERRRNIIIPYGRDENGKIKYGKIRLQYGLEIPYLMGAGLVQVGMGRRNPFDVTLDIANNVLTAFNPLGGTPLNSAHGLARMVLPDALDVGLDLGFNRNWQGRQIFYGDQPLQPGGEVRSEIGSAKKQFGIDWNATARLLNNITGGDEAYRGYLDLQPEAWRYLAGTFGGSSLRTAERLADISMDMYRSAVLGDDAPDFRKAPIIRRYLGKGPDNPYPTNYYEIRRRVRAAERSAKSYEDGKRNDQAREVRNTVDGSRAMVSRMRSAEKSVRRLRAEIRKLDDKLRQGVDNEAERNRLIARHRKATDAMTEAMRKMVKYYTDKGGDL